MLNGRSCWEIEREEGISHSITNRWLNKYNEQGIKELENQKNQGIHYVSIKTRKICLI